MPCVAFCTGVPVFIWTGVPCGGVSAEIVRCWVAGGCEGGIGVRAGVGCVALADEVEEAGIWSSATEGIAT